jgi:hypothetical protein
MQMKVRRQHSGGRSTGLLVLAVVLAGILGSVLSYYMAGAFPEGPVRDFFFKAVKIGVPAFQLDLGFASLAFGLSFAVTTLVVVLIALAVYLWYKF